VQFKLGLSWKRAKAAIKCFFLPEDHTGRGTPPFCPSMAISRKSPIPLEDMPAKALQKCPILPYVLFALWNHCPKKEEEKFPVGAYINHCGKWAILMFRTLNVAQKAIIEKPWLRRSGILVDWRKLDNAPAPMTGGVPYSCEAAQRTCYMCKELCIETEMMVGFSSDDLYCPTCYTSRKSWVNFEKIEAIKMVVSVVLFFEGMDDMFPRENLLRKQIVVQFETKCASKKQAALWIKESIESGNLVESKLPKIKSKVICLPKNIKWVLDAYKQEDITTPKEVDFVKDLLWDNNGWMLKKDVASSLKTKFERMSTPVLRQNVFTNASRDEIFCTAIGIDTCVVAFTREDALAALELLVTDSKRNIIAILEDKRSLLTMEDHIQLDGLTSTIDIIE